MRPGRYGFLLAAAVLVAAGGIMSKEETKTEYGAMLSRYAPATMSLDLHKLPEKDREMLKHLLAAAEQIDEIFWRQSYSKAADLRDRLKASKDPADRMLLDLVMLNAGPFDRLEDFKPFYGTDPAPLGAGFYPEDLTRKEFEDYVAAHPESREIGRAHV